MRVLMTTDTMGGVWNYCLQLASVLGRYGVEVDLATMGRAPTDAQRQAAMVLPNVQMHVSEFRLEWMPNPWGDVDRAGQWLLDLERRTRPDIVHLNGYSHGVLPFTAPVIVAGHSCVLSWWRAVRGEEAPAEWDEYRRRVRAGLRAATRVIAPSETMLNSLVADYGPFRAAKFIYNARSAEAFIPATKLHMIISIGRLWDQAKNLLTLDKIAGRLPWPVYVAGESRHPAGGTTRSEHVTYLGTLAERQVALRLGRASIYVLPARYEPFGLSILEAALAGCALVIGDIPTLREIWHDSALFVPPDDSEMLAAHIGRLISQPAELARYSALAQVRAREFTIERFGREYMGAYAALLRGSTRNHAPSTIA